MDSPEVLTYERQLVGFAQMKSLSQLPGYAPVIERIVRDHKLDALDADTLIEMEGEVAEYQEWKEKNKTPS